ncbi:hypothetical protein [Streptomyces mexicanus]|uniref:hypothetical protein n=1 Tax=Streptomyces mexicanus TaxID=178566 RepID=UPI0031EF4D46
MPNVESHSYAVFALGADGAGLHAALRRQESRGGHSREDYPQKTASWRRLLMVCAGDADGRIRLTQEVQKPMREDLMNLSQYIELEKCVTREDLAGHDGGG